MSMYNEKLLNITNHSGSANQSHDTTVTPTRMALIKQTNRKPQKIAGVGEDGETSEPWALVVGMWRTAWGPLKKSSVDLSLDLPISLLYSKVEKAGPQDDNRAPGLMAALFTMARKQKQPGSPDR